MTYSYDDPDYFRDAHNFTDLSDDEQGAVAMTVESESDNEELNPYWMKIKAEELHGLRNPMKVLLSDIDSMPDLVSASESEDSVISILTSPNSSCSMDSERSVMSFDEEMLELVNDEGEDGRTTFDATMLVNVEGCVDGIQTKLYDSGASHHMLPYEDHFKNYVSIAPKPITAADKCYFQAIGKGNLQIKIPNSSGTTTILLKDVLHCPDMGLTLVSIGKITAAGYKVIFRGLTCRIFDSKDTPRAAKFGDEIHSDVWGPSPVQTPGHKDYYVSFTDDHT